MTEEEDDARPPARVGRIVVALIGLVVGLILLNGGLNLLGAPPEPAPPADPGVPATTPAPPATPPR